ncbi:Cytochrome c1 heme lyase [Tilletia horrida]|nr:Cytochrome c1 heme lyase [Tilletia horrida]
MWPFSAQGSGGSSSGGGAASGSDAPLAPHPLPPGVTTADRCPVDESTRQAWLNTQQQPRSEGGGDGQADPRSGLVKAASASAAYGGKVGETSAAGGRAAAAEARRVASLSKNREVSSIPRAGLAGYNGGEGEQQQQQRDAGREHPSAAARGAAAVLLGEGKEAGSSDSGSGSGNWVYPSPAQFYSAMARKNHNPSAQDMPIVVSIHNAVNERAWQEIIAWERGWAGRTRLEAAAGAAATSDGVGPAAGAAAGTLRRKEPAEECGGLKLVSFIGKPKQLTWRAWGRTLLGYEAPFDRHDWIVDRCGVQVRYIIDFYTGRPTVAARTSPTGGPAQNLAFYLDVRPAPDSVEGWAMRLHRTWLRVSGRAPVPGDP